MWTRVRTRMRSCLRLRLSMSLRLNQLRCVSSLCVCVCVCFQHPLISANFSCMSVAFCSCLQPDRADPLPAPAQAQQPPSVTIQGFTI